MDTVIKIVLALIGIAAGIFMGIGYARAMTYGSVRKNNTFVDEGNPEMTPASNGVTTGSRAFLGVMGSIFLILGVFVLIYAISHWGMTASELSELAGPNTHVGAEPGTLAVFGGFACFIGGLMLIAAITGNYTKG